MHFRLIACLCTLGTWVAFGINGNVRADGWISGTVMDDEAAPIGGIWVDAYDTDGELVASDMSLTNGTYVIGLAPSNYYVRTDSLELNYRDEWYDDIPAENGWIPLFAELVTVSEGISTSGVDFVLTEGAQIAGTVRDAFTDLPITNVWVDVYDSTEVRIDYTWTDTDGTYVIRGLPSGTYGVRTDTYPLNYVDVWYDDVVVIGSGIPAEAETLVLFSGSSQTNIDFTLMPGAGCEGQVTNAFGSPLADVFVDAYMTNGVWLDFTATDANGAFELNGLPAGLFYVRTFTPDQNLADEWFDDVPAIGLSIPDSAIPLPMVSGIVLSNINFSLDTGATIAGAVYKEGAGPLTNIDVDVYAPGNEWQAGIGTSTGGTYVIDGLPAGTFHVRTYSGGLNLIDEWYDDIAILGSALSSNATGIALAAGTGTNGIDFVLSEGGSFAGTVTDTGGIAIAGATVDLFVSGSGEWANGGVTDSNGTYVVSGLPASAYALLATDGDQGYADEWYEDIPYLGSGIPTNATTPTATPGVTNSGLDFVLDLGAVVTGLVTDVAMIPLAGVEVSILTATGSEITDTFSAYDGTYQLSGLPPVTVYVKATADALNHVSEWYDDVAAMGIAIPTNAFSLTLTPSGTTVVSFALAEGGSFTGLVTDTSTQSVEGVAIDVYDADTNWLKSVTTEGDGTYRIAGLVAPGSYFTRTYDPLGFYASEWYDDIAAPYTGIPAGATPVPIVAGVSSGRVDFVLEANGSVAGTVSDAAGSPLLDVEMLLFDAAGALMQIDATAANGTYSLPHLHPGSYHILARPIFAAFRDEWYEDIPDGGSGIPLAAAMVTVTAGEAVAGVDFVLGYYVVDTYSANGALWILWQAASGSTYRVMQSGDFLAWTNAPGGTSTATMQGILEYSPAVYPEKRKYYRIELAP